MRILMLTWEYPPRIVGGIARHVEEISWALAADPTLEVHVVTCDFPGAPAEEVVRGVHIHRVAPYDAPGGHADFFHWLHQLNAAMRDRAWALCHDWLGRKKGRAPIDPKSLGEGEAVLLHAHDWVASFAAVELKHAFKLPLVGTIHATEFGRNQGIHTDTNHYINDTEVWLTTEAWRVIVCAEFMRREVEFALNCPGDKIDVIPNGIHAEKFHFPFSAAEAADFRLRFAAPDEKLVLFVGRGVREKGAQILVEAMPQIRSASGGVKLVIAGGGHRQHLVDLAHSIGVGGNVFCTGFISDDALLRLYRVADVACFPSLYEPFGIVALEAMAAGTPVVVSDAGGLPEVVEHDLSGTVTWANNPESLAWGVTRVLQDRATALRLAKRARKRVDSHFSWTHIAADTLRVYNRVWNEYRESSW
ncbi:MAG: glycosyltransferase family 4 protein [Armatimonadetes bacterium]|nr:glycosyltransferase family 4 protein [Armatimonadota bacterium]MDE2207442.1 glycosyltransferase family 4 protein [Armatimonadota bacterium]